MVTIFFESHATTFDNENHLASGHYDVELSDLGVKQAKEMGERNADEDFAAVFCSDLKRSYMTAEIAFGKKQIKIIKDKRLRECDYGEFERKPSNIVDELKPKHISEPFPGGQSYEQTTALMKDFLNNLLKNYDGTQVLIIGHRATQYALENLIIGVPLLQAVTAPWSWQPGWVYPLIKVK